MTLSSGTALNLFVFDLPRLSVDIDLDYVGAADRQTMLAEKPRIETGIQQVAGRMGLNVKRVPTEHAGGKWRLTYTGASGRTGTIEVDVNFMLRTPLWPAGRRDSHAIGGAKRSAPCFSMRTSWPPGSWRRWSRAVPAGTCSTRASCFAVRIWTARSCGSASSSRRGQSRRLAHDRR